MIRNFKALGLALVAMFAMSAVVASAAQAESNAMVKFTDTNNQTVSQAQLTGEQEGVNVFTRGAVPVTCATAKYNSHGLVLDNATTITIKPEYSSCHATGPFGETWPVTVTNTNCHYLIHLTETGNDTWTGIPTVVKGTEAHNCVITLDVYTSAANHASNTSLCTISVPAQNPGGHLHFVNKAAEGITPHKWVTGTATVTNITSNRAGSALCGAAHHTTGALHGALSIKAEDNLGNSVHGEIVTDP